MKHSSWNEFLGKNPNDPEGAFEALCRLLFRARFGIGDSLPYFYNNPGIETSPVKVGTEVIGFQAKFFSGPTIDDSQANVLIRSIQTSITRYASEKQVKLTKIILYTNSVFSFPNPGEDATKRQKRVEKIMHDSGLSFEWMFGDNILDAVDKTPLAYSLFFDISSNLSHLANSVGKTNQLFFDNINSSIPYKGREIMIDRSNEVGKLKELLSQKKNVFIHGESGSGKTAIVKQHWLSCKDTEGIAYYMTLGIQYDSRSINDLFVMEEEYSYVGFRDFYSGHDTKILVVDSAERLTEIENKTVVQLLLEGLSERGWLFIFTCKSNAYDDLRSLLRDINVAVEDIKVESISEEQLVKICDLHSIPLPGDRKLRHQIQLPFYLARYCEIDGVEDETAVAFRELVWTHKVRGLVKGGIQQKREDCLLQIVAEQQNKNSYYVKPIGIDHDMAFALINEDILTQHPHKGYAVKHDIYTDWALDIIFDQEFNSGQVCVSVLNKAPKSVSYSNAFRRWLSSIVDNNDIRVKAIMDAYMAGSIHIKWEHVLLTIVGRSEEYVVSFFKNYDVNLKASNYTLFDKFVDALCVSCQEVTQYIEHKGEKYPVYKPTGRGWEEAVLFVSKNRDDYYMNHLGAVLKLLDFYSRKGGSSSATSLAALLSLHLFNVIADRRKQGEYFWGDKLNEWSAVVCRYAYGIRVELTNVFKQVVEHNWISHRDPYAELVSYILKDSNHANKVMLYFVCTDSIIALMSLFWREQAQKNKRRSWDNGNEYLFGLNEEFGIHMSYFPPSPFQTPVKSLLETEHLIDPQSTDVVDFLISFIDDCVLTYEKRATNNEIEHIPVRMTDGTEHDVILSLPIWNTYRGTSANICMPYLLESIHMALESYLLGLVDRNKQKTDWDLEKRLLWRILAKSHSASMYAIVASLAVAYPEELYDVLLFLCQDIRFLLADLHRCSSEVRASGLSFTFHRHEQWWRERDQSNKLSHRQKHLETVLLDCQYAYDHSTSDVAKSRLEKAYQTVEALKKQSEIFGKIDSTYLFIAARIDYKTYDREEVKLDNGIVAEKLTPRFSPELKKESEAVGRLANEMEAISLRVWADRVFKGQEGELKGNAYISNPRRALETINEVEEQLKEKAPFLLPGDEYVPYMASAVLLMRHRDKLKDEELKSCWDRVMLALNSLGAMASNSLSELYICLSAIPVMLDIYPQEAARFEPIIDRCVQAPDRYIDRRICDMMSEVICNGQLWEKHPELMNNVLSSLRSHLSGGVFDTMSPEQADAFLCLLTYEPPIPLREIGNICLDKLSSLWQKSTEYNRYDWQSQIAENIAKYVLFSPTEEVPRLVEPYVSSLNVESSEEALITEFVLAAPQYGKYENFWIVWESFYQTITTKSSHYYLNAILNEYLLNPLFISKDFDDWFILEEKDLEFYERIVADIGGHPVVVYALSRVFGTIGKAYGKQAIGLFHKIISVYNPQLRDSKAHVIYYLEKIVQKVFRENELDMKQDPQFKAHYITVLEFMRDNGSTKASEMIQQM